MGFSEGNEEETLLNCFVCKNPFGMLASFCGNCGCNRSQALGIERVNTRQTVNLNVPIQQPMGLGNTQVSTPISREPQPTTPTYDWNAPQNQGVGPQPPAFNRQATYGARPVAPPKVKKQKSNKGMIFRQNLNLRTNAIVQWQEKNHRAINGLGLLSFMLAFYVLTQTIIFSQSSPVEASASYITSGIQRNSSYASDRSTLKHFPSKYSQWDASTAPLWLTRYSTNGWFGSASVTFAAQSSAVSDETIEVKMTAKYQSKWLIFRTVEWVPEGDPATLNLTYPKYDNFFIFINGLAAGTTRNPEVPEGQYILYPGTLEITYYDEYGNEADESVYYFVNSSGTYSN